MKIHMDQLIRTISTALDIVEGECLGASTNHGKRVAVLCAAMGREFGLSGEELNALVSCALLHDNALTEYIIAEREGKEHDPAMKAHCEFGQRNVETLQFNTDITGVLLYHHEAADGSGPFGKKEGEFPLMAEFIKICDSLDVQCHLQRVEGQALPVLRERIRSRTGTEYTNRAAKLLLKVLNDSMLNDLRD
jgi:HD-GYP domain-containing protein (c-di-GMP phosphodiesterase class II)